MTGNNSAPGRSETGSATQVAGSAGSELRKKSRIAALWYLLLTVTGPVVLIYFPGKFNVPGDAAATFASIMAAQALYRLWIVIGLVSLIIYLFTGLSLYALFAAVDKAKAGVMAVLVIVCVPLGLVTSLFKLVALQLGSGAAHLEAFSPAQLQSLAMVFLDMDKQGEIISHAFWGLWLLPLGILVIRSGFFPKILGVLQVIACFGYLASFLTGMLFPGSDGVIRFIITVMLLGELPFIFWLIIVGARVKPPRQAAPAGA